MICFWLIRFPLNNPIVNWFTKILKSLGFEFKCGGMHIFLFIVDHNIKSTLPKVSQACTFIFKPLIVF